MRNLWEEPLAWGTAILGLGLLIRLTMNLGKAASMEAPNPIEEQPECHYCKGKVPDYATVKRSCPNCKDEAMFHRECGTNLHAKAAFCNGTYVGHTSGHIISLKYPAMCAYCGLGKGFWMHQYCPNGLSDKTRFTMSDERWLHSMKITLEEPVESVL